MKPMLYTLLSLLILCTAVTGRSLRAVGTGDCQTDLNNAAKDIASAYDSLNQSFKSCASKVPTEQCKSDIMATLNFLAGTNFDLTNANTDCVVGSTPTTQCSADISAGLADVSSASSKVINASFSCQDPAKYEECTKDAIAALSYVGNASNDISRAISDCK